MSGYYKLGFLLSHPMHLDMALLWAPSRHLREYSTTGLLKRYKQLAFSMSNLFSFLPLELLFLGFSDCGGYGQIHNVAKVSSLRSAFTGSPTDFWSSSVPLMIKELTFIRLLIIYVLSNAWTPAPCLF